MTNIKSLSSAINSLCKYAEENASNPPPSLPSILGPQEKEPEEEKEDNDDDDVKINTENLMTIIQKLEQRLLSFTYMSRSPQHYLYSDLVDLEQSQSSLTFIIRIEYYQNISEVGSKYMGFVPVRFSIPLDNDFIDPNSISHQINDGPNDEALAPVQEMVESSIESIKQFISRNYQRLLHGFEMFLPNGPLDESEFEEEEDEFEQEEEEI